MENDGPEFNVLVYEVMSICQCTVRLQAPSKRIGSRFPNDHENKSVIFRALNVGIESSVFSFCYFVHTHILGNVFGNYEF